ncbi:MAG: hypothetical protein Q7K39_03250 [Candidatus Magasanikbacteria bacterium]|nr:hypothetical protein [Candidatus Magasanikbacteria bacterium]
MIMIRKVLNNIFLTGTLLLSGLIFTNFVFTNFVSAVGLYDAGGKLEQAVGADSQVGLRGDLTSTITTVVTAVLAVVGTVFLLLTIYAGILWMTAAGAEDQIEKAQNIIKATVIGLFITMGAYAITAFVGGRLSG